MLSRDCDFYYFWVLARIKPRPNPSNTKNLLPYDVAIGHVSFVLGLHDTSALPHSTVAAYDVSMLKQAKVFPTHYVRVTAHVLLHVS